MATERRDRIKNYVGPKRMLLREELPSFETGDWVAEPKLDGFWCLAEIQGGRIAALSSRTGLPLDGAHGGDLIGAKVGHDGLTGLLCGELTADTVNGERCGTRRLHLFDALEWCGIDLRGRNTVVRREALELIHQHLTCAPAPRCSPEILRLVERRDAGFLAWYDEIVTAGGEGLVLKAKTSLYVCRNSDGKVDTWHRVKPLRTVDYVVMGHGLAEKGTPNVDLGLYKIVKGAPKLVKTLTVALVSLKVPAASLVGSVLECAGYEIWPSGALRSAKIVRIRTDKLPTDCTIDAVMAEHGTAAKED